MKEEIAWLIDFLKSEGGLESAIELINQADLFKPVVGAIVSAIVSYGPELSQLIEPVRRAGVERRIESIRQYESAGFTKQDAIMMTLDDVAQIKDVIQRANVKGKA